jgi:hypothetical protein
LSLLVVLLAGAGCAGSRLIIVSKWERFEQTFESALVYTNPPQQAELRVTFTAPSGEQRAVFGFWDGGQTWRVRFSPDEVGKWSFATTCSDSSNTGLHGQAGNFVCTAARLETRFGQHGPVRVSPNRRYLLHDDGTPFFWLSDTAWNGALLSTPEEWDFYIRERVRQKFTAVQFVTTQWRAAPEGDREGHLAFTGHQPIWIDPAFFRRMDEKIDALNRGGLLAAPVLLWAIGGGSNPLVNPGHSLPEDQAIRLARYMVARWQGNDVVWILPGDGDYRGPRAEKWKRIGRAVFGEIAHAPTMLHPGGMHWNLPDFQDERWLDLIGYQSGHGDNDATLRWMFAGPPATDWKKNPPRPFLNLEPPYENHLAYHSKQPHSPDAVRRAIYWSLLGAPTAGVSYGGHGVWGWDDGTKPPIDHAGTGIPLSWQKALTMPAAEQMRHAFDFFNAIDFWRLRPAPAVLATQPGEREPRRHLAAARSEDGDLLVVYSPEERAVELKLGGLPPNFVSSWHNPRTGEKAPVVAVVNDQTIQFATPGEGDWLLLLRTERK